jgi:hypothetical protein
MFRDIKRLSQNLKRVAVIAVVFFAFLCIPATVFARPWENTDSVPPGNIYVPVPSHINAPSNFAPRSWRSDMLSEIPFTRRHEGLDIRGNVPVILDSFLSAREINEYIMEDIVASLIAEARRLRARAISFTYEYYPTEDIISIVIYADVVTTLPHTLVRSVNFDVFAGQILTMDGATGMEISTLAERILSERIRSNPERYFAALSAPLSTQSFYLTDERLVILFDGFRLSTRVGDVDSIELFLSNINSVVLTEDDYRQDGPYGLKMIPLRAMFEGRFGLDVVWDEFEQRAIIYLNGLEFIVLSANDNEYIVIGTPSQRRSLEAAPQMIEDRMYIPITFFDQILPLTTFTIGNDRSITFLSYLEN